MNDMDSFNEKTKEIEATLLQIRNCLAERLKLEDKLLKLFEELCSGKK